MQPVMASEVALTEVLSILSAELARQETHRPVFAKEMERIDHAIESRNLDETRSQNGNAIGTK